jgi:hypothetical protein
MLTRSLLLLKLILHSPGALIRFGWKPCWTRFRRLPGKIQENLDKRRVCSRAANKVRIVVVLNVLFGMIARSGVVGVCLLAQFGSLVGCASPPTQSSHRSYYSWFRQAAVVQKTCPQNPNSLASSSIVGHKPEIRNHGK